MGKKIFKYKLSFPHSTIEVPAYGKILALQSQNDWPCLWIEVYPDYGLETRQFRTVGTGHDVPGGEYVGTYQQGEFVWHVYEVSP